MLQQINLTLQNILEKILFLEIFLYVEIIGNVFMNGIVQKIGIFGDEKMIVSKIIGDMIYSDMITEGNDLVLNDIMYHRCENGVKLLKFFGIYIVENLLVI